MPDQDEKPVEIIAQLEQQYSSAFAAIAVYMDDVIKSADRAKLPPKIFAASLHASAQYIEQVGVEMAASMRTVISCADRCADRAQLPPPKFIAWLHAIAQHIEQVDRLELPDTGDDEEMAEE